MKTSTRVTSLTTITLATALTLGAPPLVLAEGTPDWTGCYAGLNAGYVWSNVSGNFLGYSGEPPVSYDIGSATLTGGAIGGQLGCDYQRDKIVIGGRVAMDWTNTSGSHVFRDGTSPNDRMEYDLQYFGTLTARLGYLFQPATLGYLSGGYAWGKTEQTDSDPTPGYGISPYSDSFDLDRSGWTLGLGVEHRFQPNLSLFLAYDYIDFGTKNTSVSCACSSAQEHYEFDQNMSLLSLGLNYRF